MRHTDDLKNAMARINVEQDRANGDTNRKQVRLWDRQVATRDLRENADHDEAYLAGFVAAATRVST